MVLTDSPYHAWQSVTWAKTIAMGDHREPRNPFKWDRVVLNFPRSEGYDCKCPWLYKEHKGDMIVSDLFVFVDYCRPIGPTEEVFWEVLRGWGSMCACLVIQYAYRKLKPPLQAPRPWSGTVTATGEVVCGLVSQYWWDKTQRLIEELSTMDKNEGYRDGMDMERL